MIAIRVGQPNRFEMEELRGIASPPSSVNLIEVGQYSLLNTQLNNVFGLICNGKDLSYCHLKSLISFSHNLG